MEGVEATEQPHVDLALLDMCVLWPRVWPKCVASQTLASKGAAYNRSVQFKICRVVSRHCTYIISTISIANG